MDRVSMRECQGASQVTPAPFAYHRAHSVDEAVALLAELGEEAKILAGGLSLVPMMNLRLARPSAWQATGEQAAGQVDPPDDTFATGQYRRRLTATLEGPRAMGDPL
jgi:CO/xanthine dehydrogenase FAD-binding subunit